LSCAAGSAGGDDGRDGIAPRDVTPEATVAVCERLVEGIAEQMRLQGMHKTRFAALSRAVCGIRGTSLILNLPGSPAGAVESLEAVRICCRTRWS
jgi:molybdopterin adenylyltransferase